MLSRLTGTLRLQLLRRLKPKQVRLPGDIKVDVDPQFSQRIKEAMWLGKYEFTEAQILRQRLRPTDVVIELGGGIGYTSTLCSKIVGSESVYVFEANPALGPLLEHTWSLNSVRPKLSLVALGPAKGEMSFHVHPAFWASSAVDAAKARAEKTLTVPVEPFAEVCNTLPKRPNFLLIDIEGGEYEFFRSVTLDHIQKILCEIHPWILSEERIVELGDVLHDRGFRLDRNLSQKSHWYLERAT
jgi:FkbM family methyltransferase